MLKKPEVFPPGTRLRLSDASHMMADVGALCTAWHTDPRDAERGMTCVRWDKPNNHNQSDGGFYSWRFERVP